MNVAKLLKLARMVMHFGEIPTNNGVLIIDGDAEVGKEVFIDVDGEIVPAPNNDYILEDQTIYVVEDGKIKEIVPIPTEEKQPEVVEETVVVAEEETPVEEEPKEDEKDLRIAELEGLLKDRDAVIEELTQKIKELEDKQKAPVEKSVEMKASVMNKTNAYNEYFK